MAAQKDDQLGIKKQFGIHMNNLYPQKNILKRCQEKLSSPVESFYWLPLDPEIIRQEKLRGGKPVTWYEMYLVHGFLALVIIFAVGANMGVHWSGWVGLGGLLLTGPLFVFEAYRYRSRSFSREVTNMRTMLLLFMLINAGYFVHLL